MQNLINVNFVNSGYGEDAGRMSCEKVELTMDSNDSPILKIKSPFGSDNILTARFIDGDWRCDLDQGVE